MKEMKIKTTEKENQEKAIIGIRAMNLASDFFKCRNCGYTVRILAIGNTARCSQCGGTMDRC